MLDDLVYKLFTMSIVVPINLGKYLLSVISITAFGIGLSSSQTMWLMVHEEEEVASAIDVTDTIIEKRQPDVLEEKLTKDSAKQVKTLYKKGWRRDITATIFWVGEEACRANPVHNKASSWDMNWVKSYGGVDAPYARNRFKPKDFSPKMNPFYIALPYNDIASTKAAKHKPGLAKLIWWYKQEYKTKYLSVCKGKWLAIEKDGKTCYAQWEDCGPFVTDDWRYVFQGKSPKKNRNNNAGIDISPSIRDYLNAQSGSKVSWKFVEEYEVEFGPWSKWLKNKRSLSKNP